MLKCKQNKRFCVEIVLETKIYYNSNLKMPLIIMTGFPSSGKTRRSKELAEFFRERGKTVHIVSENIAIPKAGFTKNEYYADSQKEKVVRSDLKSETVRLLTKDNVVILDGGNYIKGISIFHSYLQMNLILLNEFMCLTGNILDFRVSL